MDIESAVQPEPAPPSPADGQVHRLAPQWISYRRAVAVVRLCIFVPLLAGGAWVMAYGELLPAAVAWPLAGGLAVALAALMLAWPPLAYRHASWRLDASGLEVRHGVLWRSIIDVRRSRIQHSDVSQGPVERRYGLGTLRLHTAGTAHARLQLRGISHEHALAVREFLMQHSDEDVV